MSLTDFYFSPWESGRSFRQLFESLPDAVLMVDATGRIRLANAQAVHMFGYDAKELQGMTVEQLVPERLRGGHAGYRQRYFASPEVRPMGLGLELRAVRRDGSEFAVEISLSPFETGLEKMVFAAIRDITGYQREVQELRRRVAELEAELAAERARLETELAAPRRDEGFGSG